MTLQQYKLFVEDRNYEKIKICYSKSLEEINIPNFDCVSNKLFNQDLFEYIDNKIKVIHSAIRETEHIPGVLVCNTQKTYGRKKDKFYYKCIPDDIRLPIFLVPYKIKLGFNKNISNKYIIFKPSKLFILVVTHLSKMGLSFDDYLGYHPTVIVDNIKSFISSR